MHTVTERRVRDPNNKGQEPGPGLHGVPNLPNLRSLVLTKFIYPLSEHWQSSVSSAGPYAAYDCNLRTLATAVVPNEPNPGNDSNQVLQQKYDQ